MSASDLRELADWADSGARWLEQTARRPNDNDDPTLRTISFDAAVLDDFLTGFRGMPDVLRVVADTLERQRSLKVIAGGLRDTRPAA